MSVEPTGFRGTKGEWQVFTSPDGRPYIRADAFGPIIGKAYRNSVGHGALDGESNATLFAASKDLLAALQWYADKVAACRKITGEGHNARVDLDRDGGAKARAAIARAVEVGK